MTDAGVSAASRPIVVSVAPRPSGVSPVSAASRPSGLSASRPSCMSAALRPWMEAVL